MYDCLEAWWKYGYEVEYFWVSGILLICVGVLGLLGNIANLIVLFQIDLRKKVFYKLLILLALFDILFIASYGITTGYQSLACQPTNDNVGYFTFYFHKIATIGSCYTIVAVSLERYLGICHPHAKFGRKVSFYIFPVIIVTTFVNAPIVLERECDVVNKTVICPQHDWAKSKEYKIYANVIWFIFYLLIPLPTLILTNGAITYKMMHSSRTVKAISKKIWHAQKSTTKIMFLIVINMFVYQGWRIAYRTLYLVSCRNEQESVGEDCIDKREEMTKWNFIAPIEKLTQMFNSSINFFIYCFVGRTFRKVFYRIFHLDKLNQG